VFCGFCVVCHVQTVSEVPSLQQRRGSVYGVGVTLDGRDMAAVDSDAEGEDGGGEAMDTVPSLLSRRQAPSTRTLPVPSIAKPSAAAGGGGGGVTATVVVADAGNKQPFRSSSAVPAPRVKAQSGPLASTAGAAGGGRGGDGVSTTAAGAASSSRPSTSDPGLSASLGASMTRALSRAGRPPADEPGVGVRCGGFLRQSMADEGSPL
jgi:hypothetical protein